MSYYLYKFFVITILLLIFIFLKLKIFSFIWAFIYVWFSFLFMFLQVLFFTTCERKILALTQRRLGPTVIGTRGRLQYFADAIKILVKHYVGPRKIHSTFFQGASVATFWLSWYNFSNLTFNYGEDIAEIDFNVFFFICCSTVFSFAILVSGWASISKYALLGCIRACIQFISYELLMSSIFLCLFLVTGTSNFEIFIDQEARFAIIFFLPIAGIISFLATLMETNRPPFDLSEAESDVVAGYTVEYAGVLFGLFYLGEYVNIFTNSFVLTILFVGGGWNLFAQCSNIFFYINVLFCKFYRNVSGSNFFFFNYLKIIDFNLFILHNLYIKCVFWIFISECFSIFIIFLLCSFTFIFVYFLWFNKFVLKSFIFRFKL